MLPSQAVRVGSRRGRLLVGAAAISPTSAASDFPRRPACWEGERRVCRCSPAEALGVGSSEEQAFALVAAAGVGSCHNTPSDVVEAQRGQVVERVLEAEGDVAGDLFHDEQIGHQVAKGFGDVGPQVARVIGPFPFAGDAERLAGGAAGDDVDAWHPRPVDLGDVAEIRCMQAGGQHGGRGGVGVAGPGEPGAVGVFYGQVESADAAAQ
nr:hypothetical protein [Streptacidiphilus neutrinimicus]